MTTDDTTAPVGIELTELTEMVRATSDPPCHFICDPVVVPTIFVESA